MNTLSFPEFLRRIRASASFSEVIRALRAQKFPLEVEGADGSFASILTAEVAPYAQGPLLAVTPTEKEAEELVADLRALQLDAQAFPWWGTMPYRDMAPLSKVFGERSRVLADLVGGNIKIVVVPQRALLTPLPPPKYLESLLIPLRRGGRIDTAALAEQLSSYGYTRVPRVQVHGEFALRGEVLDVFMGGDEYAYRILFDFDTIESIKTFDPEDQSGTESVAFLLLRPLKEVLWTDDRIEALERTLRGLEEFPSGGAALLERLMTHRNAEGEELFFPLAFDHSGTLIDYLNFFFPWLLTTAGP